MYRKLRRTWSHNNANYIPKFIEVFPELNKVSSEDMCDRWIKLGITFYTEEKTPVKPWIRFTMPFAIILIFIMIIGLPFWFLITGHWTYSLGKNNRILNWFRALGF